MESYNHSSYGRNQHIEEEECFTSRRSVGFTLVGSRSFLDIMISSVDLFSFSVPTLPSVYTSKWLGINIANVEKKKMLFTSQKWIWESVKMQLYNRVDYLCLRKQSSKSKLFFLFFFISNKRTVIEYSLIIINQHFLFVVVELLTYEVIKTCCMIKNEKRPNKFKRMQGKWHFFLN